jgi:type IV pilus assembly protein PilN
MIRINLLAIERERTKRRATFQLAEKVTVACSLILVVTGVFLAWWWWTLSRQAADLERDIAAAQGETARLRVVIARVQQAEQRRNQLEQRVELIEQLRKSQTAPVHLLYQVSRNLPDGLWLMTLQQNGADVTLEGRCLVLSAVSELVNNVQSSGYFKKPVDVSTDTEKNDQAGSELVKFTLKAQYAPPGIPLAPDVGQPAVAPKPGAPAK